jgi:hypothetical protein
LEVKANCSGNGNDLYSLLWNLYFSESKSMSGYVSNH